MAASESAHFLDYLFTDMRTRGDRLLLCENRGSLVQNVTHREGMNRVGSFAKALLALSVEPGKRVALHVPASTSMLICEWALLAVKAVAVIIPRHFSADELIETLAESKSTIVLVERLATAYHLAEAASQLPDLAHIVCVEGGGHGAIPITGWNDFLDAGLTAADRATALLRTISPKDTALLFYYRDEDGKRQAIRYTHESLLNQTGRIIGTLGSDNIRSGELVLTATGWEHPIGHLTSCYVPVLCEACVQITHAVPGIALFENGPQVIVGDGAFFDGLRHTILSAVRHSGQLESSLLQEALSLSKQRFESQKNAGMLAVFKQRIMDATVIKKVKKMLGGNMRLLIGTDAETQYETELFFHTFGITLTELPPEAFR